jgi:hypothetical protein
VVADSINRRAVITVDGTARKFVTRGKADPTVSVHQELAGLVSRMTGWEIRLAVEENG